MLNTPNRPGNSHVRNNTSTSTPRSAQRTLQECRVESIGKSYNLSTFISKGLVPVVTQTCPFATFCMRVREANNKDIKLKMAAESIDPWANCPVKCASFAQKENEHQRPWKYIASVWKADFPCLDLNLNTNPDYVQQPCSNQLCRRSPTI